MDHETKKFIKQAKHEIRVLTDEPSFVACSKQEREEVELMMLTSIGGSAGLGYFLPLLWRTYRHSDRRNARVRNDDRSTNHRSATA